MKSKRFGAAAKSRTNRAGGQTEVARLLLEIILERTRSPRRAGCCCCRSLNRESRLVRLRGIEILSIEISKQRKRMKFVELFLALVERGCFLTM